MKSAFTLLCGLAFTPLLSAQSLVNGTNYNDLFGPNGSNVTVDPPNNGLLSVVVSASQAGPSSLGTYWNGTATGGASVSLLGLGLVESGAQVALTGSSLDFKVSNPGLINGLIGAGLGVGNNLLQTTWSATATFDKAGNELVLQPNTTYRVSFLADGSNGLLNSTLGIAPSFSVELLDGSNTAIGSSGNGTLVNIIGLLGTGVPSGVVTVDFTTGAVVDSNPASLRFKGQSTLNVSALNLGNTFASVSGLSITQVPETSSALLGAMGAALLLRRRRD